MSAICYSFQVEMMSTNHAIMINLVHALGKYPKVPGPCCVPEELSSISVLYLTDESTLLLKVFKKMSVKRCGCR